MSKRLTDIRPSQTRGFTLIELMVVVAIIAIVVAAALPNLLPALLYSTHEGAARHLANYGRSAIAHVALMRETITVKIDLDSQEYWSEHLPEVDTAEEEEPVTADTDLPEDDQQLFQMAQEELRLPEDEQRSEEHGKILNEQTNRMARQFNTRSRQTLTARAQRVIHDQQGILQGRDGLFGDEFKLGGPDEVEIEPEEVDDPLLERTRLPEGVFIEFVQIGDLQHTEGVVDIELTPLGLGIEVVFSIVNEEGNVFRVVWDPVTGAGTLSEYGGT